MLSSGLRNWQQENKFRISDDTVYGVFENVGFSVTEEDGGRLFIFMLAGADDAFDRLEDLLCGQGGALSRAQVGDVESYPALFFDDADGRLSSDDMSDLLDFMAGSFRTCGFRIPNVCVKCGAPATKRAFYNDMVQPLCGPCREADKLEKAHKAAAPAASDRGTEYAPQPQRGYDEPRRDPYRDEYDDRRQPQRGYDDRGYDDRRDYAPQPDPWDNPRSREDGRAEGNAPAGFFGALLGSLAGLVPYIISTFIIANDTVFGLTILCFAAGVGAVFGYTSFGGVRIKKNALATVITLSLIISLLASLVFAFAANISNGFSVILGNIIQFAGINPLLAVLGALLGVGVSLDTLYKYLSGRDNNRSRQY